MPIHSNLRQALGHFATGVTIVTSRDADGQPVGVTVNSFNAVSLDPPLILWSLARRAYSFDTFASQRHFAVHILSAHQQFLSDRFARAGTDKFADIELKEGLGGAPLLSDCAAVFQCETEARYDGGDHVIVLGRVQAYQTREHPPLLFYRGRYAPPAIAHGLGYDEATHHSHP